MRPTRDIDGARRRGTGTVVRATTHRTTLALAAAVLACAAAAGCSSGSNGSSSGAGGSSDEGVAPATAGGRSTGRAVADLATDGDAAGGSLSSADGAAAVRTRAVVRTGEVSLTSSDLGAVRRDVDALLRTVGGTVDRDVTRNDRHGRPATSRLVLRVPVADFDTVLSGVQKLGRQTSSSSGEKDVTTQVIDTAERVQTLQNSLDRLQRFQRRATDVRDLIRFEEQITTRQSELQSLTAQQAYLADQTSMSTITVHLATPERTVPPEDALEDAGFGAGLAGGWHALVAATVVALTALGAALPFLVVLALVGLPARVLLRRWRTRAAA